MAVVEEFVYAVKEKWPHCLIQFEDFSTDRAFAILHRLRDKVLCFNDDIQVGTKQSSPDPIELLLEELCFEASWQYRIMQPHGLVCFTLEIFMDLVHVLLLLTPHPLN